MRMINILGMALVATAAAATAQTPPGMRSYDVGEPLTQPAHPQTAGKFMVVAIAATSSSDHACKVTKEYTVNNEADISKSIVVMIEHYKKACGSIIGMTLKVHR